MLGAALIIFLLIGSASAGEVLVHYNRPDGDYDNWTLWTWNPDESSKSLEVSSQGSDDFGLIFRLKMEGYGNVKRLGILPKFKNWEKKDDPDRNWSSLAGNDVYLVSGDKNLYSTRPKLTAKVVKALIDDTDRIRLVLSKSVQSDQLRPDRISILDGDGQSHSVRSWKPADGGQGKTKVIDAYLESPFPIDRITGAAALVLDYDSGPILPGKIIDNPSVFYTDLPLGAVYAPEGTIFRTFSPTSLQVTLRLYQTATGGTPLDYPMHRTDAGLWELQVEGDCNNWYYKYLVQYVDGQYEVIDPYSRCNTSHNGRGMVVDDHTPVAAAPVFPPQDAIIYELHVRDFTIDSASGIPPEYRGKYLGLTEVGTRYADDESVLTGLDHLKELGVNVVQIMPIQDFDNNEASNDYNWGYMPYHFFSPDGWYATKRDDATRVREFKQMIDALHRNGIKATMDVVFNHTAEGNPNVRMSFNGLAPNYYYRCKDDGSYWNGSGCGNEFRTESPMGRKFILDSMKYWVTECGVDGFRFDLMGLIDVETLKQAVKELRVVKPDILIYGEPWAGGETPIDKTEKGDQRGLGFGVFNDNFRDAIKGNVGNAKASGFAQGWPEVYRIKKGIKGSIGDFAKEPTESINYVEAHDNHTLWDRIQISTNIGYPVTPEARVKMDLMAAALILTSQGIPFLQCGQEMLRTKDGDDNSYNKPDSVNEIHWSWKKENHDVFETYKALIHLRRDHPMFRMGSAAEIQGHLFFLDQDVGLRVPSNSVGYILDHGVTEDEWADAAVLFNAKSTPALFQLPHARWLPVSVGAFRPPVYESAEDGADSVTVPARTMAILYQTDATLYDRILKPVLAANQKTRRHEFIVSAPKANRVSVAGSFNSWKADDLMLKKLPKGKWSLEMELEPGSYEYKFVADGDWKTLNDGNRQLTIY